MIPRIREVHLRNCRSIQQAVVRLSELTVLVGPNGSGKSNFMDALAFVQECLALSIEAAMRNRSGFTQVCYGFADANAVGFRLVLELSSSTVADYAFELTLSDSGAIEVQEERCVISEHGVEKHRFEVKNGEFSTPIPGLRAAIERDRLALYAASAVPEFRPVYAFLVGIRLYSIQPDRMRDPREPGPGVTLETEGGNSAAVLNHLQEHSPDRYQRVRGLLQTVVPALHSVKGATGLGRQFLMFTERGNPSKPVLALSPLGVSDGTLRMLGLLLAAYQPTTPTMLLIEEPEATIHPAAVDSIMALLLDATKRSQVIVTTHSPDVLDYKSLPDDSIRVVTRTDQGTSIASLAPAPHQAIRERVYSPGELLRVDELNADVPAAQTLAEATHLFGAPVHSFEEGA